MQGPEAPNPQATAAAQGAANREAAVAGSIVNNINETTPFGSIAYTKLGEETIKDAQGKDVTVPRYQRTTTLSPDQQALLEQQTAAGKGMNELAISQIGRLQGTLNDPLTLEGLTPRSTDFSADRQRVEDAIMSRLEPRFQKDEDALRTRLQVQGNTPGSEIFNDQLENLNQAKTDARVQAILAGGDEQSRLAGLSADTRNAELQERLALRNQPINEVSTLLGGGQVSVPQFTSPYRQGVSAAPVGDYINQDYANRVNQYQGQLSGIAGLGGTLARGMFGLSDERAKKDIRKIGMMGSGIPVKSFRYKAGGPRQIGVIAQDVRKRMPDAVARRRDGMMMVDYAKVAARG